jgi:hypothetical protein
MEKQKRIKRVVADFENNGFTASICAVLDLLAGGYGREAARILKQE